ncbi:FtsW/RodA/SpoVE family cell cycle protein [Helicobacter sp. 23-1045]
MDRQLFYLVTFLLSFSVVMAYSLSVYAVDYYEYGAFHFFIRQFIAVSFGILIMWILSQIPAEKLITKFGFFVLFSSALLLVAMQFLPESFATSAGGAKRWIRLFGFSLAPSEYFKIGFIMFLAWSFSRRFVGQKKESLWSEILTLLPYIVVIFGFIIAFIAIMQNDLGQVVLMAIIFGIMLLFAGGSLKLFGVIVLSSLILFITAVASSQNRIARVKMWWGNIQDYVISFLPQNLAENIRVDSSPEPYQVYYSLSAVSNGGIFGRGLGDGSIKLGFLSEVHTDIVLAGLCEELGLIGLGIFVIVFALILHRILKIANHAPNHIYSLFCIGVCVSFAFSFLINAFGVAGIIPIKGIAVPFLSYGGSAVVASCICIGMVLSISKSKLKDS